MKPIAAGFAALVFAAGLSGCAVGPADAQTASVKTSFSAKDKSLRQIYEHLHANPELSFQERNTSAILAAEMKRLGFAVTTNVGDAWVKARAQATHGKVEDGVGGYGLVAVLKNGDGPTLMIRADMDALPVVEKTGLPYASTKRDIAWSGEEGGVMHACGHDIHMTAWLGTARELVARKAEWKGTLVMIAQPAEEIGLGAMSMIEDGLFTRFPKADFNIALHDSADGPAGSIGHASGYVMANVDSVDIHVKGRGGHGAYPEKAIDPIVIGARIVSTLQTLISRELDPKDAAVITVGAFNAGTKHNIIPDTAHLQLTVRSYSDAARAQLLKGIERIAKAEGMAAGLEGDALPDVIFSEHFTPSVYNDPELTGRLVKLFEGMFGADNIQSSPTSMVGEDFSRYGRTDPRTPSTMFWIGAVEKGAWERAKMPGARPLPSLHSSTFAPDPDPTIATGVKAMTSAALELLK